MQFIKLLLVTTLSCAGGYVFAQANDNLLAGVRTCMSITDNTARLACFDALATDMGIPDAKVQAISVAPSASAPPEAAAIHGPIPTAVPPTIVDSETKKTEEAVANFGTNARVENNSAGQPELLDRVADVTEREPGKLLVTLESGQVWYQVNSERFRLRKGMEVRVYPGPLGGSYRLSSDEIKGFIQVQRVR